MNKKQNLIQWIDRCEQMPKDKDAILISTNDGYVLTCMFDAQSYEYIYYNTNESEVRRPFTNVKYWAAIPKDTKVWHDRMEGEQPKDGQLVVVRGLGILAGRYNDDKYEIVVDLEGDVDHEWLYSFIWWLEIPDVPQA